MAYKIINGKLAAETDKNYLDVSSSKRELFDALKAQVKRAEAAEARAAELEAQLTGAATVVVTLTTERDSERKEREALYPVLDEKSRVITMLRADVAQLTAERDELARKLEIAYAVCDNLRMSIVNNISA